MGGTGFVGIEPTALRRLERRRDAAGAQVDETRRRVASIVREVDALNPVDGRLAEVAAWCRDQAADVRRRLSVIDLAQKPWGSAYLVGLGIRSFDEAIAYARDSRRGNGVGVAPPGRLDRDLGDFEAMTTAERRKWLADFMNTYEAAGWYTKDWFNAIDGILKFAEKQEIITPGSWFSWVDAAILEGIQDGMAVAIDPTRIPAGDENDARWKTAAKWADFLRKLRNDDGRTSDALVGLWSTAEESATKRGEALAAGHGTEPSVGEAFVASAARLFRSILRESHRTFCAR